MSSITRERLLTIQQWRETFGPGSNVVLPAEEAEELACIALASLEAEAVAVNDDMAYAFHHALYDSSLGADEVEEIKYGLRAAFANVTAPPAQVSVPDEATPENIEILASTFAPRGVTYQWDRDECNAAADSWNTCRAAMLQGADGNSPVIQDGSEDTKRLDWLDAQNKRLNEYYGTTYGWKFDANFSRKQKRFVEPY